MHEEYDDHGEPVTDRYRVDPRAANDAWNYGVSFGLFVGGTIVAFIVWLWSKT